MEGLPASDPGQVRFAVLEKTMATHPTAIKNRISALPQPRTYQEMLNYLLPTQQIGGQLMVPHILPSPAPRLNADNDVDPACDGNPRTPIGVDLAYSILDPG